MDVIKAEPIPVTKITLALPSEAYDLLLQGASEAGIDAEEFARICIYSVLANCAKAIPIDGKRVEEVSSKVDGHNAPDSSLLDSDIRSPGYLNERLDLNHK